MGDFGKVRRTRRPVATCRHLKKPLQGMGWRQGVDCVGWVGKFSLLARAALALLLSDNPVTGMEKTVDRLCSDS